MDETNQAEKPLRRVGRPRKVAEGADVEVVNTVKAFLAPLDGPRTLEPEPSAFAQAFAQKVWDAQSPGEPRAWRLMRVAEAMKNRGLSMVGVKL